MKYPFCKYRCIFIFYNFLNFQLGCKQMEIMAIITTILKKWCFDFLMLIIIFLDTFFTVFTCIIYKNMILKAVL